MVRRLLIAGLVVLAFALVSLGQGWATVLDGGADGAHRVRVVLHRFGARVGPGDDDPVAFRSDVVRQQGIADGVDMPAFGGGDRAWNALMRCVKEQFASFDVDIDDDMTRREGAILTLVGGSPNLFGQKSEVGGLAPYTGTVLPRAVVFVFESPHDSTHALCATTAHEIGHALGLDHSRLCSDVMSYGSCGPKAFRDRESACGEWAERECTNGGRTQNSWVTLAAHTQSHPSVPSPDTPVRTLALLRSPFDLLRRLLSWQPISV